MKIKLLNGLLSERKIHTSLPLRDEKKKKVQTRQVAEDSGVRNPRIAALAEVRES